MPFWSPTSRWLFWKTSIVSTSMSSDHRDARCKAFLPPQWSNFALSLAVLKYEVNKWCLIFEGIWRWPVINLFTLISGCSYLTSFEIVIRYRKVRSFQGTQVNLCVLLEKPYITCPSRNSWYNISRPKLQN